MKINSRNKIFYYVIGLILLKLLLLPFSQTTDADAVTRVFRSLEWVNNPVWRPSVQWPPIYFYVQGLFLYLYEDLILTPKLLNIVLSCLTLIPLYSVLKREFNEKGAWFSVISFSLSSIVFRNSFMALSMTMFVFFLVMFFNQWSKARREGLNWNWVVASFMFFAASGIRYESWLLLPWLFWWGWKSKRLLFVSTLLVFPLIWTISNYLIKSDALASVQWVFNAWENKQEISNGIKLKRVWFFPFSWIISIGPVLAFLIIKKVILKVREGRFNEYRNYVFLILPLLSTFLIYLFNAQKGSLLLQHRFTIFLLLLSLPIMTVSFSKFKTIKLFGIHLIVLIGGSFIYNTGGFNMIPRLENQETVDIVNMLNKNLDNEIPVMIDFFSWEDSYYMALNLKQTRSNKMILSNGYKEKDIHKKLSERTEKSLYVLSLKKSQLNSYLKQRKSDKIGSFNDKIFVYSLILE